jgi:hypothetical protein
MLSQRCSYNQCMSVKTKESKRYIHYIYYVLLIETQSNVTLINFCSIVTLPESSTWCPRLKYQYCLISVFKSSCAVSDLLLAMTFSALLTLFLSAISNIVLLLLLLLLLLLSRKRINYYRRYCVD